MTKRKDKADTPVPDPSNSPPQEWTGDEVDDTDLIWQALVEEPDQKQVPKLVGG